MKSHDVTHHPNFDGNNLSTVEDARSPNVQWIDDIETEVANAERAPWQTIIFPGAELKLRSEWIARTNAMPAGSVMAACLNARSLEFIFASDCEAVFLLGPEANAYVADNPSWYFDFTAHLGGFAVKGSTSIH